MQHSSFLMKHRRPILTALCATGIGISAMMFALVPGGRLAFLFCGLGAAGTLYREFVPKRG